MELTQFFHSLYTIPYGIHSQSLFFIRVYTSLHMESMESTWNTPCGFHDHSIPFYMYSMVKISILSHFIHYSVWNPWNPPIPYGSHYSILPDHIHILSPLSSLTPTPQPPPTSAALTCLFQHTQPLHTNLCIPTHILSFSPLSILTTTPQPPPNSDTHNCIPSLFLLSILMPKP